MKKITIIAAMMLATVIKSQIVPVHIVETVPEILCKGDSIDVKFVFTNTITPTVPFSIELSMAHGPLLWIDTIFTGYVGSLVSVDTLQTGEPIYETKQKVPQITPAGQWTITANIMSPDYTYITVNQCVATPTIVSYSPASLCPGDTMCISVYDPLHNAFYFNIETQSTWQPNVLYWFETQWGALQSDTMNICYQIPYFLPSGPAMIGLNLESLTPVMLLDCGLGIGESAPDKITEDATYYNLQGIPVEPKKGDFLIWRTKTNQGKIIWNKEN